MADNTPLTADAAVKSASDVVTHSGQEAQVDLVELVLVTGAADDAARAPVKLTGDVTNGLDVDVTRMPAATAAAVTRTASSATNVASLVALNTTRRALVIHNNSTATLYIKYGATASLTGGSESYSYAIPPSGHWEMPNPIYTGRIDGIWSAANGFCMASEVSP